MKKSTKIRGVAACLSAAVLAAGVGLALQNTQVFAEAAELAPIARYEFKDPTNLGKDSAGNFDLLTYGTTLTNGSDEKGSYLNFASGGALYATELESGKDFSDYLSDYTISFGLKKETATGEWNPVLATGNGYTDGLTVFAANGNIDAKHRGTDVLGAASELNGETWGTVTLTFDKSLGEFKCYVNGALKTTQTGLNEFTLGVEWFAFAIGARYNQYSHTITDESFATGGAIRDVRIYDCVFTAENAAALYAGEKIVADESLNKIETLTAEANYKVRPEVSDETLLKMSGLISLSATDTEGNRYDDLTCVYTSVVRAADSPKITVRGIVLDPRVANAAAKGFACEVGLYTSADSVLLKPVVRYEFDDPKNLGKDSMGHFDLLTYGTSLTNGKDEKGSFLNFASGGALYAQDLDGTADFSDYFSDYTISFGLKRTVAGGADWGPVLATGNGYANGSGDAGITVFAAGGNVDVKLSGKDAAIDYLSPAGEITSEKWSVVTITFDGAKGVLKCYVDGQLKGTHAADFHLGLDSFAFTIGGRYNQYSDSIVDAGLPSAFAADGAIRDVRIYDCALNAQNVLDLAGGDEAVLDGLTAIESVIDIPEANFKIDASLSDSEILSMKDLAPETVEVRATDGKNYSSPVFWLGVERTSKQALVKGLLFGGVSNAAGVALEIEVPFAAEKDMGELKPLARYEFRDSTNLGKDSMGHFDLAMKGKGLRQGADGASLDFNDNLTGYLQAADLGGGKDFSDYLSSYTISFLIKKDISGTDAWNDVIVSAGSYESGLTVQGADGKLTAFLDSGTFAQKAGLNESINNEAYAYIAVAYDAESGRCSVYIDGVFAACVYGDPAKDALAGAGDYAFTIGGRSQLLTNNAFTIMTSGVLKDVRVYDYALSSQNIYDLHRANAGYTSVLPYTYIAKIAAPAVNNVVRAENPLETILSGLPETVAVTLGDGAAAQEKIVWLPTAGEGKLRGFLCSKLANVGGEFVEIPLKYAQKISIAHASLQNVEVNGAAYEGDFLLSFRDVLAFEVTADAHYAVTEVKIGDSVLAPLNGVYTVEVNDYSDIFVSAEAVKYRVRYHTDTGDGVVNRYYTIEDEKIDLLAVEKAGYTFDGWYASADFAGERVLSLSPSDAEDKELFARFTKIAYLVSFKADGETLKTERVDFGKKPTDYTPEKQGYTFDGWYKDEALTELYDFDAALSGDLTLYAKFTPAKVEAKKGCGKGCGGVAGIGGVLAAGALALGLVFGKKRKS